MGLGEEGGEGEDSVQEWQYLLGVLQERYETWEEAVSRVMNMHRDYYKDKMSPELGQLIDEAESLYKLKYALGAQRALQFGGEQLLKHQMRMYNCTSTYADRPRFFSELFSYIYQICIYLLIDLPNFRRKCVFSPNPV